MNLSKKIKTLRTGLSMTQKELGNAINVSSVSIGCWENGTKKPSVEAIVALAEVFNVTTDYLLNVKTIKNETLVLFPNEKKLISEYRCLDDYGKRAVSIICSIEKDRLDSVREVKFHTIMQGKCIPRYITPSAAGVSMPIDGEDFEMIPVDSSVPQDADFAVKIQGNSMNPYIYDGDTVYVKRCNEISIGDIGLFCVEGAMYCKQYYIDNNRNLLLLSSNPDLKHTNIFITSDSTSEVRCYGKVIINGNINLPEYFVSNT